MSVNRPARAQFAEALRQFRDGLITNWELLDIIDKIASSDAGRDASIDELERKLSFMFDDPFELYRIASYSCKKSSAGHTFRERVRSLLYEDMFRKFRTSPDSSKALNALSEARAFLDRCICFLETDYEYVKCTRTIKQHVKTCLAKCIHMITLGFYRNATNATVEPEVPVETWPFSKTQKDLWDSQKARERSID